MMPCCYKVAMATRYWLNGISIYGLSVLRQAEEFPIHDQQEHDTLYIF